MKRGLRVALAGVSLVTLGLPLMPAARAERQAVARLQVGESAFWDGVPLAADETKSYRLDLLETGTRLRVAIDVPDRMDEFQIRLKAPDTGQAELHEAYTTYSFNAEVFVDKPAQGSWEVVVTSYTAEATPFRLRAKLEDATPPSKAPVQLRPNLRPVAPYEFTFIAPVTGPNTIGNDYNNRPLDVAGAHPASCSFDEMVDHRSQRCLRFTAGIENAGDGPLDLRFQPVQDATAPAMDQVVYLSNGKTIRREAGTFEFHPNHYHYHYTEIWSFRLLEVLDPTRGTMEDVGRGHKSGFCPGDQKFAEWRRFNQDPIYTHYGNCGMDDEQYLYAWPDPDEGVMALSTGWGDIYRWYRPGNYVEFGGLAEGRYVVQVIVDTNRWVLETTEEDNVAYAYVDIKGEEIELLERGLGKSPWDPKRSVITDWWEAPNSTDD